MNIPISPPLPVLRRGSSSSRGFQSSSGAFSSTDDGDDDEEDVLANFVSGSKVSNCNCKRKYNSISHTDWDVGEGFVLLF